MSYETVLKGIVERDPDVIVMTAENRAAIRGLPPLIGKRFIDVGISEQTMIGMAAGFALRGRKPICHALATFLLMRAFEFVRTDVGIPRLPVKLVGGVPGFLSEANGPTHQAIEDVALMRGIPGFEVLTPSDEWELERALAAMMERPSPAYLRYNPAKAEVPHEEPYEVGKAETLLPGTEVAILSYGLLVGESYKAAKLLHDRGLKARMVNLRTLAPVDTKAILAAAGETRAIFTIEDHFRTGGLYSIVCETLVEAKMAAKVVPIALEARWFRPTLLKKVLEVEGFTAEQLASRIWREMR